MALRDPAGARRTLARDGPDRSPQGRGGGGPGSLSRRRLVHRGGPHSGLDPRADRGAATVPLHQASSRRTRRAIPGISRLAQRPSRVQVGGGLVRPPPWDERRDCGVAPPWWVSTRTDVRPGCGARMRGGREFRQTAPLWRFLRRLWRRGAVPGPAAGLMAATALGATALGALSVAAESEQA